jgi:hypothetical protein
MKSAIELFLSAGRSILGTLLFKIREQTSRHFDLIISGG